MIDGMSDMGSVIRDIEGGLWRVLEFTDEGLFMLRLPERPDVLHTRTVTWQHVAEFGYELKSVSSL
jgi:hypothetical protein